MKYIVETKGVIGNYNNDIKYKTVKDMNKEQYVSFEVAKLLKQKGFNWFTYAYYTKDDVDKKPYFGMENLCSDNWNKKPNDFWYSAPTVYEVIDWLETKGYWIVYRPLDYYKGVIVSILAADDVDKWYDVNNITAETKYEGLNKALEFCLEKLIR